MKKIAIFAVKTALIASVSFAVPQARASGIPVLDAANLSQSVMDVLESIQQGLTQVEQYATQIDQYATQVRQFEQEVQNTIAPAMYVWDKANQYVSMGQNIMNEVKAFADNPSALGSHFDKYQNPGTYRSSPCYKGTGCSAAQRKAEADRFDYQANASKGALETQVKMLAQELRQMRSDGNNLESIQQQTEGAQGRMQAAQAANQLAANTANQLLAIRGMLVASQQAEATRNQQLMDQEARRTAADEAATAGTFKRSQGKAY